MTPRQSRALRELDELFRRLPGARTETRPLREVLEHEVAALGDAHRARSPAAAELVRLARWQLGRQDDTDRAIFEAELTTDQAREDIARYHRFSAWSEALAHGRETVDPKFEAAADAIVAGDDAALRSLIASDPSLAHARSAFGHHATLLQHVAANGIEESRQWQSPPNAVEIAEILLRAGAHVDATCDCYGGGMTALTLLVSSDHPARAGVQVALVEALLDGGASVDGIPGQASSPVATAVAFGYPAAAEALAKRGAQVADVVVAAGLGRLELVERLAGETPQRVDEAFLSACARGRTEVADLLLEKGADIGKQDHLGFTGLHSAAFHGHTDTVEFLVERGAPLEVKNVWGGTVLDQTIWAAMHDEHGVDHLPVIARLVAAGARVDAVSPQPTGNERIDAVLGAANGALPNPHAPPTRLYPLFLKLEGRAALVVGAGSVAERKIAALLEAGARVRVVAPEATDGVKRLVAEGSVEWRARAFEASDADGVWVAVAATSDAGVQRAVAQAAEERRVFVVAVDDVPNASAYSGSVVRRDPFAIAISSSGEAPALTRLLREIVEQLIPPDDWVEEAKRLRARWMADGTPMGERFAELVRTLKER
jgi:siroheme synthase-like protein